MIATSEMQQDLHLYIVGYFIGHELQISIESGFITGENLMSICEIKEFTLKVNYYEDIIKFVPKIFKTLEYIIL